MEAARNKDSLIFQGHRYQIFQDLSQQTLIKWKMIKPHLQILQYHRISYRWCFPFAIRFSYKDVYYTCKLVDDLLTTIHDLCLAIPENTTEGSKRQATSSSPANQHDVHDTSSPLQQPQKEPLRLTTVSFRRPNGLKYLLMVIRCLRNYILCHYTYKVPRDVVP